MRFSMHIPHKHFDDFADLNDFFWVPPDVSWKGIGSHYREAAREKEVWLDDGTYYGVQLSSNRSWETLFEELVKAAEKINATHIVIPDGGEEDFAGMSTFYTTKGVDWLKARGLSLKTIGVWRGFEKDLARLQHITDVVVLPHHRPRNRYVTRATASRFHYGGFRTFSELEAALPLSIDTDAPVAAAVEGCDLQNSCRRASLAPMSFDVKLSSEEIVAARRLAILIKETKAAPQNKTIGDRQ